MRKKAAKWMVLALSLSLGLSACDVVFDLIATGLDPEIQNEPIDLLPGTPSPTGETTAVVVPPISSETQPEEAEVLPLQPAPPSEIEGARQRLTQPYTIRWSPGQTVRQLIFPVAAELLPEKADASDFVLERFDPETQSWQAEGLLLGFNAEASQVAFEVSAPSLPGEALSDALTLQQLGGSYLYRIRVYLFSNALTVRKEGSRFAITYYPAAYNYADSVLRNADWEGSGLDEEERIPNFIEDLDQALNQAYDALLTIQNSQGDKLFKALPEPIQVSVQDTGGSAGNSPLGGPAKISNRKLQSYQDMQQVVAHELVHVLQGQVYPVSAWVGGILDKVGALDRWMIEASANYYAARALQLSAAQKGQFFSDQGRYIQSYLTQPITSNDDNSFYALGDFLDWLATQGNPEIVADILTSGRARDVLGMSEVIRSSTDYSGVGDALSAYAQHILTHPNYQGNFAQTVKNNMRAQSKAFSSDRARGFSFSNQKTYFEFKRDFPALSSTYLVLAGTYLSKDSLLVVHPIAVNRRLRSLTYGFYGRSNADYEAAEALDNTVTLLGEKDLVVKHFGKGQKVPAVESMLTNPDLTSAQSGQFEAYVLQAPQPTEVIDGKVSWDKSFLGNIPTRLIKGLNVYVSSGNVQIKKDIPVDALSFEDPAIRADSPLTLTVTDIYGNEWPEVERKNVNIELQNMVFSEPSANTAFMPVNSSVTVSLKVTGYQDPTLKWSVAPYGIPTAGSAGELVITPFPGATGPYGSGSIRTLDAQAHNVVFTAERTGPMFLIAQVASDPFARYPIFLNIISLQDASDLGEVQDLPDIGGF